MPYTVYLILVVREAEGDAAAEADDDPLLSQGSDRSMDDDTLEAGLIFMLQAPDGCITDTVTSTIYQALDGAGDASQILHDTIMNCGDDDLGDQQAEVLDELRGDSGKVRHCSYHHCYH